MNKTWNVDAFQLKRASSNKWTKLNPILTIGEIGYDTTSKNIKIGDGVSAWNSLDYFINSSGGDIAGDLNLKNNGNITGNLNVRGHLNLTENTNPTFALSASNFNYYVQQYQDLLALGNGFTKSVTIDANGKAVFPEIPYYTDKPLSTKDNVNMLSMCASENLIANIYDLTAFQNATVIDYTVPANGYVYVSFNTLSNIQILNALVAQYNSNGNIFSTSGMSATPTGYAYEYCMSVPVAKGQTARLILYDSNKITNFISRFIYAKEV